MRELNQNETEAITGGFQFSNLTKKALLNSIMPDYVLPLDFNKKLATLNISEDYISKTSESS